MTTIMQLTIACDAEQCDATTTDAVNGSVLPRGEDLLPLVILAEKAADQRDAVLGDG